MREYLLVFLIAATVTYLGSGLCRRIAVRAGAVAQVRERDMHTVPIPYLGGLAMFFGVAAAFVVAVNLPFLGRLELVRHDAWAVLAAAGVICAVGVLDDLFELNALAKLAGQILAAGLVVALGVKMLWIPLPDRIFTLNDASSIAITVFFIVLCTNAVNYVDGLDGLAAGVIAIGALAFFSYAYWLTWDQDIFRATTASLITVAAAGACIGFLPHNFTPARMFMGDSGSMLLGLLLATSAISLTGQIDSTRLVDSGAERAGGLLPAYLPLILPIAALALPILDFSLAFVRRTIRGHWWWVADKQHLHHQLVARGHSHRNAVLLMYVWAAIISFGTIAIGMTGQWTTLILLAVLILIIARLTIGPLRRSRPAG
ncbi:MraY family glycosyltransferase [Naumannella halotolerans]|uniref:UDP-GlcNAc:undecaprenyl-phosphate GlcNAc-1-phosphate transferase n=1 Tax=Naumannella halotolerans TaxID=993414 RepID=A0A4R7JB50_9ACTN|nr:MraY family glycosyltransferase [Naumannella halotolerans]TDT33649.1 UDP-GlcNAc:undecaprenyl-phosphate GlcNAc-1-phosphate transferase [Naumannella halotolerans]